MSRVSSQAAARRFCSFFSESVRGVLVAGFFVGLAMQPLPVLAADDACLTGSDPVAADDKAQIEALRTLVDSSCACASYDGSAGKTHADYVKCALAVIKAGAAEEPPALRKKCVGTMKKIVSKTTCGYAAAVAAAPCIKTVTKSGKRSCSIVATMLADGSTPSGKCEASGSVERLSCSGYDSCIEAVDFNADLVFDAGDRGDCMPQTSLLSLSTGRFVIYDGDTGSLSATGDDDETLAERISLLPGAKGTYRLYAEGNGRYFSVHGDDFVYADAATTDLAQAWVAFVDIDNDTVLFLRETVAGSIVEALAVDGSGRVFVLEGSVLDVLSDPATAFRLVDH